jgi:predicted lipoprotein with Yx(FWY)xxD motif
MRSRLLGRMLAALIVAAIVAGVPAAPAMADRDRAGVRLADSRYGRIIVDAGGLTLYAFTKDERGKSRCYGSCAAAWPPLLTKSKPEALAGARSKRLGTTKRRDGSTQVTYGGSPLYYYIGENAPGEIFCQNVFQYGGLWLLVNRGGDPIR